jgi:hypothetical protein
MDQSRRCPACTAALADGATWCATCGTAVPDPAPTAPESPAPRKPADPVRSAANWALWLSLPGFCCFPIGAIGAFFGVRAVARARSANRSVPARALVALVLGALSLLWTSWFFVSIHNDGKARRRLRDAVTERLAGKREAAELDPKVACDLVEEQLRQGLYEGLDAVEVVCRAPLEAAGGQARLRGVEMRVSTLRIPLNACLARTDRWFLLGVTALDKCPAVPPAEPASSPDRAEDAMRKRARKELDEEEVAAFLDALNRLTREIDTSTREARYCPQIPIETLKTDTEARALQLHTVDLELAGLRPDMDLEPEWNFLSSAEVRLAVDASRPAAKRAEAVRRIGRDGGPFLVAYVGEDRAWPRERFESTTEGRWTGWMVVVDTRADERVCEARLSFGSEAVGKGRKASKRLDKATESFTEDFRDKASEAMATMSSGQFRLGYKFAK